MHDGGECHAIELLQSARKIGNEFPKAEDNSVERNASKLGNKEKRAWLPLN